ncbi:isopeptide-forming domain-containing fimbrial protein [Serinibacter arcticus]|uniref:isopeptide-forming domain-containing fimbrial protein n=1 Tax=Serinibacter arcticus TaxID=1655435 RepID=UPI0011B1F409|nr:isopeptide-forming domain-containing fimbrial protein [Serinibacter arcticus]
METEHPVPGFTLTKTSDPVSGSTVTGGDTITYTVTGTNTGATVLDPVVITDDLAEVLNNAELTGEAVATIGDETVAAPVLAGTTLTWTGSLAVGQTVTVTYTVTLDADVPAGTVVNNVASGSATPPGLPPIEPPPVETEHPVPGFTLTKTSDPVSGSTVVGGDTITYTVTGTNTGATVLDPVVITDDLAAVLNNADLIGEAVATIGDETAPAPVLEGTTLTWTGSLAVGQTVTVTYSVSLSDDVPAGTVINNIASGSATPPGLPPIEPPPVETEHPVPGFELTKTADPVSGSTVLGGDTITYTVTGTNTGATVLDPVVITDDLSAVLDNAVFNSDAVAVVTDQEAAQLVLEGTTLTWNGSLAVGESVTITYSVTVNADAAGAVLHNIASGEGTPPGLPPITPPTVETEHPVPGFEVTKTSDPVSGTAVQGGQTITYTVTGTNTGATVLDPVVITDDMAAVLNNAEFNPDSVSMVSDDAPGALVLEGTTLTWSGSLGVGGSITITYSVTVNEDAAGVLINNIASGSATPPGVPPITPPPVETEHPVPPGPTPPVTPPSPPVTPPVTPPATPTKPTPPLAHTGAAITTAAVAALLLTGLGGGLLVARRRRRGEV